EPDLVSDHWWSGRLAGRTDHEGQGLWRVGQHWYRDCRLVYWRLPVWPVAAVGPRCHWSPGYRNSRGRAAAGHRQQDQEGLTWSYLSLLFLRPSPACCCWCCRLRWSSTG